MPQVAVGTLVGAELNAVPLECLRGALLGDALSRAPELVLGTVPVRVGAGAVGPVDATTNGWMKVSACSAHIAPQSTSPPMNVFQS